jgi:hypothetical protein
MISEINGSVSGWGGVQMIGGIKSEEMIGVELSEDRKQSQVSSTSGRV